MDIGRTRISCGLWLVLLLACRELSAFNLDIDNVVQKTGEKDSLFGFSLAMHRQVYPTDKRMLLVGAPKAKALSGQKAKVTGGLYSCDFSSPSSPCTRVDFDNDEDLRQESKENQWMGVTVNSQGPGGKIVTCAHRYQHRTNVNTALESRDIIGRCYVLSQDLTIDPGSDEDGGNWRFCEGRVRGHERFGSCQQGLSATFTKDYHYLIFGAPGAYNWKGVVRVEQKNNTLIEMGFYDDGPYEAGDENKMDPDLVPVPANSYLGFSLDSGKSLTKKDQLIVVAGAPRANHSGAVVLLKKGPDTENILVKEYILEGEGLASSFGYDLAVLDFNGDGWQDIVVGAPQYFEKEKDIGGAIYIYVNQAGAWDKVTPTRIEGPQDSMFGLAVENMGDINQDGFHDVAIGAPYDDHGAGNVYIYHGSDKEINKKPSQMLFGQPSARLFGYSLAGNMDLDKNLLPDLAVGSLSDTVFIYRSRPVINIQKDVKITPKEIDFTKKNCGSNICLSVEACLTYTANPKSYSPKLTVAYSIEADAERRKNGLLSRVIFEQGSSADQNYESKGTVTLAGQGKKQCFTRKLIVQDNIRDKLRGIPIQVSVDIQDAKRKRRQSAPSSLMPVMDANEPTTYRTEVNFLKEGCGTDNVCQSNLQVTYRYCNRKPNQDVFIPMDMDGELPVVSLGDQKEIALEVTVTNMNGDDAYEASVVASFPPTLTYSAFRVLPNEKPVSCTANKNGSQAECELGNPFKRDAKTTFYIILGTAGISLNTTEVKIDLLPTTTSEQQSVAPVAAKAKVVIELQLSLTGQAQPSQVYFTGEVKGQDAMKKESDIGSAIRYQFTIINLGKPLASFGTASLAIHWPKETSVGKWLLYLMKINSTGVQRTDCSSSQEVNPLKLKEEPGHIRRRRAMEDTRKQEEGSISLLTDQRKYKTLSCDNGAKCVLIRCPLQDMDSNAVITLNARLWNGTFIEDFSNLNYLEVIAKASLHVRGTTKNMVLKNPETQVRLTVFPERRAAQYGGLPWWIILVAILLGLLLLGLLVFLLWKCGFFKRAKYEDNVPSYNAVRIKREERDIKPGNDSWENLEKKPWMTNWHDDEHDC